MNWLFLVLSFLMPVVQPVMASGVQRVQARLQQKPAAQPQAYAQPPQPVYHHDGRNWYKFENGQWYVWRETPNNAGVK